MTYSLIATSYIPPNKFFYLQDWPKHKLACNKFSGKNNEPPLKEWVKPVPSSRRHIFTNEEMLAGPNQPMDPPPKFAYINDWWKDRVFTAPDGQQFTASFLPPQFKELIRAGLRDKSLTWDYLCSDNFMFLIIQATFPLGRLADLIVAMRRMNPKPPAAVHVECIIEHYWRTHTCIGYEEFNLDMHNALRENDLVIPLTYSGHFCDDLRRFTHRGGGSNKLPLQPCLCWHCRKRPFLDSIEEEAWERIRARESDRGRYLMSYKMYKDLCSRDADARLWSIDDSGPGQMSTWVYPDDENAQITRVSKQKGKEVAAILDAAHREKRLPTHTELDKIVALITVSKEVFEKEEDDFAIAAYEAAEARVAQLQREGVMLIDSEGDDDDEGRRPTTRTTRKESPARKPKTCTPQSPKPPPGTNSDRSTPDAAIKNPLSGGGAGGLSPRPSRSCANRVLSYADPDEKGEISGDDEGDFWDESDGESGEEGSAEGETSSQEEEEEDGLDGEGYGDEKVGAGKRRRTSRSPSSDPGSSLKRSSGGGNGGGQRKGQGGNQGKWNEADEGALREAVAAQGGLPEDGRVPYGFWSNVVEMIFDARGVRFKGIQCRKKWCHITAGPPRVWTQEEEKALKSAVRGSWNRSIKTQKNGYWEGISEQVGHSSFHCAQKWNSMGKPLDGDVKHDHFSPEEDAVILKGVHNGDSWVAIGKRLNRIGDCIRHRYTMKLKDK